MHITENRVLLLIQKKQQWRRLVRKQVTSAQETLGRVISSLRVSVMVSITHARSNRVPTMRANRPVITSCLTWGSAKAVVQVETRNKQDLCGN